MKLVIDLEKGIGKDLLLKYPDGEWITISGKHVYLKKDGQIADETPIEPQEKSKTTHSKAKPLLAATKDELEVGQLYKHGNSTVKIEKIGTKWVYGKAASGKEVKLEKSKLGSQQWEALTEDLEKESDKDKVIGFAKTSANTSEMGDKIIKEGLYDAYQALLNSEELQGASGLFAKYHEDHDAEFAEETDLTKIVNLAKESASVSDLLSEIMDQKLTLSFPNVMAQEEVKSVSELFNKYHPKKEEETPKPGEYWHVKNTDMTYKILEVNDYTVLLESNFKGSKGIKAGLKSFLSFSEKVATPPPSAEKVTTPTSPVEEAVTPPPSAEEVLTALAKKHGSFGLFYTAVNTAKLGKVAEDFMEESGHIFLHEFYAKVHADKDVSEHTKPTALEERLKKVAETSKSYGEFGMAAEYSDFEKFCDQAKMEFPKSTREYARLMYFKQIKGLAPMTAVEKKKVIDGLHAFAQAHYDHGVFSQHLIYTPGLRDEFIEAIGNDEFMNFHNAHRATPKNEFVTKEEAIATLSPLVKKLTKDEFAGVVEDNADYSQAIYFFNTDFNDTYDYITNENMSPAEKEAKTSSVLDKIKAQPSQSAAYDAVTKSEKKWLTDHGGHSSVYDAWAKITNDGKDVDTSKWTSDDRRWETYTAMQKEAKRQALKPEADREVAKLVEANIFNDETASMDISTLTEHVKKLIAEHGITLDHGEDTEAFRGAFEIMLDKAASHAKHLEHDYERQQKIPIRQARLEIALKKIHGEFFQPISPSEALQRFPFQIFHGTGVPAAKEIIQSGFHLRGGSSDFGNAAYFKTPSYDQYEKKNSDKTSPVVGQFVKENPAVIRASMTMKSEEYLDIKALGARPKDLQETIRAWKGSGHDKRTQNLALIHGKTPEQLELRDKHGVVSPEKLDEAEKALPEALRKIVTESKSPYEVYCRLKGYKAVSDILDEYRGEGWQLGIYDPKAIEVEDIGLTMRNDGDGDELDKSISAKKKTNKPYMAHKYEYKDGKLTIHAGVHMGGYAEDEEKVEKSIETNNPGGRWVTMHGRHVYVTANGELQPATAPTSFNRAKAEIPKEAQLKRLSDGAHLGGAGKKDIYGDEQGKQYIFKPGISKAGATEPFRAHIQSAMGTLGERILDDSVPITTRTLNGKFGSLQPLIPGVKGDLKKLDWHKLKPAQLRAIQQEHVLDWVMGNFDAHAGNFIMTEEGRVLGVDKEQAFRYLKDQKSHKISTEYHPNSVYGEQEPLYNTMYRDFGDQKIDLDLQAILPVLQRLEAVPDDEYREILKPYANSLGMGEKFLDDATERKNDTREEFRQFFAELTGEDFTFGDELTKAIPIVVLEKGIIPDMEKGIGKDLLDKYPGGQWVTMSGRHVYIMEDGNISKETDPGITKSRDVHQQTTKLYAHDSKEVRQGAIYSYGKGTVKVEKVGRSYVHVSNAQGKAFTVPKSKFTGKVPITGEAQGAAPQPQQGAAPQPQQGTAPQPQQGTSPQPGTTFNDGEGQSWKIKKQTDDGNFIIEQEKAGKSKMTAQQKRVFNNTGGLKRVSAGEISAMTQQGQGHADKQQTMSNEFDNTQKQQNAKEGQPSPEFDEAALPADHPGDMLPSAQSSRDNNSNQANNDNGLKNNSDGIPEVENGTEQGNTPSQDAPGQGGSSLDQHDDTLRQSKVFPETDILGGSDIGNQVEAIYKEWGKKGNTYFAPYFTSVGDGKGLAYEHGSPDYSKHTIQSLKGKDGKPAGLSYTIDQGDHIHIHYAEVSPEHRATTDRKASKNQAREKGVGARMIAEAVQHAFDSGYNGRVELDAVSAEDPQKFYKKLGFTNEGQGLHYSIEGDAAKKLLEGVKARYGGGKDKLQKAIDPKQPRFPVYQEKPDDDENWRQIEELEDKLAGFITGPASARAKKSLSDRRLLNKPKTIDSTYEDMLPNREEEEK